MALEANLNDVFIAGAGGGCFIAGTQVLTPQGNKNIEDLVPGDRVICFDDKGEYFVSPITSINSHDNKEVYKYTLWSGRTLNSTPNHWVLTSENTFQEIGKVDESLCLVDYKGQLLPIINKEYLGTFTVYNLIVSTYHTYIADGIRVHNGGGGKSGGGSAPSEDPDTLKSISYAKVIDLLCEGEIYGLVDGAKSIYFNDTRLQNVDGTYNYENVTWESRNGTQDQTPMSMFNSVESETAIGVKVGFYNAYVFSVVDPTVDKVRITLSTPQLLQQQSDGDLVGNSFDYRISYTRNGNPVYSQDFTLSGKASSKYLWNIILNLTRLEETDEFTITVTRLSEDSNESSNRNDFYVESYAKIINSILKYPNSALIGIKIDSSNFSSIPTRGYHVKLLKIKIPTNYEPVRRTYNRKSNGTLVYDSNGQPIEQLWDGTFYTAWSNNPAWCLYDLITNTRYGLGDYIDSKYLDKWSLYSIGKYCDAPVPNGYGGYEARFTLNAYIQTRDDAIKVVQDIASAFRGMVYWSAGVLSAVQDSDTQDPILQFNNSNVIEGMFSYASASKKVVHNAAIVTWNDPTLKYRQRLEYVEDRESIEKYGYNPAEFLAFGCTSRGQAHRAGKWLLYTEKVESNVVSFKAALDSAYLRPGHIIKIHDDLRAGAYQYLLGGRILSKTGTTQLTLDKSVVLDPQNTYSIRLTNYSTINNTFAITNTTSTDTITTGSTISANYLFKDTIWELKNAAGTTVDKGLVGYFTTNKILNLGKIVTISGSGYSLILRRTISDTQNYTITQNSGTINAVTTTTPISDTINTNALWSLISSSIDEELYKVLSIKESNDLGIYEILAVLHDPNKFNYVENSQDLLDNYTYSTLSMPPQSVKYNSITIEDSIYLNSAGQIQTLLSIGFTGSMYATSYNIYLQKGNETWKLLTRNTPYTEFTEYNVFDGSRYRVKIVPVNILGIEGTPTIYPALGQLGYLVLGKSRPPANVTAMDVLNLGDYIRLDWTPVTDLDLSFYRIKVGTTADSWTSIGTIAAGAKTDVFDMPPPTGTGTHRYFVKAIDTSNNESTNAFYADLTVNAPNAPTVNYSIIDNTIELNWQNAKNTFNIKEYTIYQNSTSSPIATVSTTTYTKAVNWTGNGVFYVRAVDVAGNTGPFSNAVNINISAPSTTSTLTFSVAGTQLLLGWTAVKGSLPIKEAEIRYGGSTWADSTFLAKTTASYFTTPINWFGSRIFRVKILDTANNYSNELSNVYEVVIPSTPSISAPVFSKTDNTVRLSWQNCQTTLPIDYYEIREGSDWQYATPLGKVYALEATLPINWSDNDGYYLIKAVDVNGNQSNIGTKIVTVTPYGAVSNFNYSYSDNLCILKWDAPISGDLALSHYEVWDGTTSAPSSKIAEVFSEEISLPVIWDTSKIVWIIPIDAKGYIGTSTYTTITRTRHSAITGFNAVLNGNVLDIIWNSSTTGSLPIKYYILEKGESSPTVEVAKINGTSFAYPVDFIGTTKFWITPIDIHVNNTYATGTITSTGNIAISAPNAPIVDSINIIGTKIEVTWHDNNSQLPVDKYIITFNGQPYIETSSNNIRIPIPYTTTGAMTVTIQTVDTNLAANNTSTATTSTASVSMPSAPTINNTTTGFVGDHYVINWNELSNSIPIEDYEIGYGGTSIAKQKTTNFTAEAQWVGDRVFWVRAIDVLGNIGATASTTLTINSPSQPSSFTSQVVDNNVLLYWSEPVSTLPIATYELREGTSWASYRKIIGTKTGNFTSLFETTSGTYIYWVAAIDSAGNYGTPKSINVLVNQPPDYILKADDYADWSSTTTSNMVVEGNSIILPFNDAEIWSTHFTDRNWTTIQHQLDDGFTKYLEPSSVEGYYEEIIDYGTLLASNKITITPTYEILSGAPLLSCDISISNNGTDWTNYYDVWNVFATNFRYVKYRVTVASAKQATYTQTGTTTITISQSLHGFTTGNTVFLDFTSGGASNTEDNTYNITVSDANTYSVVGTGARTTSGNVLVYNDSSSGLLKLNSLNIRLDAKLRTITGTVNCKAPINGTYSQSGTSITVTATAHGVVANDIVDLNFTSGSGVDEVLRAVSTTTDTITCTTTNNITTSGNVTIDGSGTYVYMTDSRAPGGTGEFIDVDAIVLSPNSTTPVIAIYDFTDTANPMYFKILLFNTSGTRINGISSYTVRGF